MDLRRLKLLSLGLWKALVLCYWLLCRRDWRNAWSFVYATLFTRDAGLALLDPIYRIFPRLASYPKQIEVETTTACQLKCQICEHSYWNEKPRHMSFEQFLQIMNMFPDLRWIGLTGIGSGFLNPDYRRMLRFLKQEKKVFVEFFDHFSHLEKSWMDEWIDLGIDKVWVSLENARAESYEKNRVGASFAKVMENL
ncbi:MAG TPA: radical SAM protein, partial [Candidatus Ozemobacteraceae bacterium]|nr:radical SAM protein [Candidatus Ozemobacteraceae bacterium]